MADNKLLGAGGLYYGGNEISKAYMGNNLVWEKVIDYSKEYFCVEALENCNVTFTPFKPIQIIYYIADEEITSNEIYNGIQNGTLSYRIFNADSTTTYSFVSLTTGKKLYIIGDKENIGGSTKRRVFSFSGRVNLLGNIMSLSHGMTTNTHVLTIPSELPNKNFNSSFTYQFGLLFYNNSTIEDTGNLILPATTLANYCYDDMFNGCTGLTTAPSLPATTLATNCYQYMLSGCTSLTTAPELPATRLANYCYFGMFYKCSTLTTAPSLPATTLADYCYYDMFSNCTGLTAAPSLPATTLTKSCYSYMFSNCTGLTAAPSLPATTLATNCYSYMFYGCTGLTAAPSLPATTLATNCYQYMFNGCTSLTAAPSLLPAMTLQNGCYNGMFYKCSTLTTAPSLPAISLVNYCYSYMFYGCTSLNYIKAMFKTTPSTYYTQNWVSGVSSRGTFVKNSAAIWNVAGDYGIPSRWTVQTASA